MHRKAVLIITQLMLLSTLCTPSLTCPCTWVWPVTGWEQLVPSRPVNTSCRLQRLQEVLPCHNWISVSSQRGDLTKVSQTRGLCLFSAGLTPVSDWLHWEIWAVNSSRWKSIMSFCEGLMVHNWLINLPSSLWLVTSYWPGTRPREILKSSSSIQVPCPLQVEWNKIFHIDKMLR